MVQRGFPLSQPQNGYPPRKEEITPWFPFNPTPVPSKKRRDQVRKGEVRSARLDDLQRLAALRVRVASSQAGGVEGGGLTWERPLLGRSGRWCVFYSAFRQGVVGSMDWPSWQK